MQETSWLPCSFSAHPSAAKATIKCWLGSREPEEQRMGESSSGKSKEVQGIFYHLPLCFKLKLSVLAGYTKKI